MKFKQKTSISFNLQVRRMKGPKKKQKEKKYSEIT